MAIDINIESQVSQTITDGVTDKAPSENAVFDALALKIGGAVSIGQVAFGTDTGVIGGDSGLIWDNTNKRLGVGTSTPNGILNAIGGVSELRFSTGFLGATPTLSVINTAPSGKATALLAGTGGSTFAFDNSGFFGIQAESKAAITSNTAGNGSIYFRVEGNGNVGVGASSAMARFDVRAQGALSTDIAFRVRNSADTLDIIRANGAGEVFVGLGAGRVSTGSNNSFFGTYAGYSNTTGENNIGIGFQSLNANTSGIRNSSLGFQSSFLNSTGQQNVALGAFAMYSNTNGSNNVSLGVQSLNNKTSGGSNIAIGSEAGRYILAGGSLTTANNSIFIGQDSRANADSQTNQIVIGHNAIGNGSNTVTLGNTSIVKTFLRGTINAGNLPTSATGLVAGDIWNDAGTLKIV